MSRNPENRRRMVVETQSARYRRAPQARPRERIVAISLIFAALLATFLALFITSRPYDPMNSTIAPQPEIPAGPADLQPSPKPSPSQSPTPLHNSSPLASPETAAAKPVDDATIQAEIHKVIGADPALARIEMETIVEEGRVTITGTAPSAQLKQRVERVVRLVKGVTSIDNQLTILEPTP